MPRNAQRRPHTLRETFRDAQRPPKKAAEMFGGDHRCTNAQRCSETLRDIQMHAQRETQKHPETWRNTSKDAQRDVQKCSGTPRRTRRKTRRAPETFTEIHRDDQRRPARSQRRQETNRAIWKRFEKLSQTLTQRDAQGKAETRRSDAQRNTQTRSERRRNDKAYVEETHPECTE